MLAKKKAHPAPGGAAAGSGAAPGGLSGEGRRPLFSRETKAPSVYPPPPCWAAGVGSPSLWSPSPPPQVVCIQQEWACLTPPTTYHQRGESLAFEQIRHQLPPPRPWAARLLLGPAHASLGHLSCVPCTETPTCPMRGGRGPSLRAGPLSPGLMQVLTKTQREPCIETLQCAAEKEMGGEAAFASELTNPPDNL